jgi:drug/metabolite transporter (DMT)-like permease
MPGYFMADVLSLAVFTMMLAAGQVLFKRVGLSVRGLPLAEGLLALLSQPLLYAALTLYGASTLLWIWILSRVPLTRAYPWVALGAFIVPMLGWWLFGERPTPIFWFGVALIASGVLLTQLGSPSP